MTITIDDIQETALVSDSYYSLLDWQQFLYLAKQAYLKLDNALNRSIAAPYNSGKWIDAQVDIKQYDEITLAMEKYARSGVPYWMYEEYKEYIEDVLSK